MREILCRGFYENKNGTSVIKINGTQIKGEWVYWNVFGRLTDSDGEKQTHKRIMDSGVAWTYDKVEDLPVINETIEQYTGLTDKNGKKIFEGDIVQYDKDGATYEIVFAEECGVTKFCSRFIPDGTLGYVNQRRDKVIGNRWDNPELLQEE